MSKTLVTPRYEPARKFEQPTRAAFEFGVEMLSIGELMDCPATRKIVEENAGWAVRMSQSEHFQPFRSTFALRDMAFFIPMDTAKTLAAVDAALKQLPQSEWPQNVR